MNAGLINPFEILHGQLLEIQKLLVDIKHKPLKDSVEPFQERFVNKHTICKLWDCSMATVDRAIRDGVIRRYYLGGGVRFKLSEVMQALEKEK